MLVIPTWQHDSNLLVQSFLPSTSCHQVLTGFYISHRVLGRCTLLITSIWWNKSCLRYKRWEITKMIYNHINICSQQIMSWGFYVLEQLHALQWPGSFLYICSINTSCITLNCYAAPIPPESLKFIFAFFTRAYTTYCTIKPRRNKWNTSTCIVCPIV